MIKLFILTPTGDFKDEVGIAGEKRKKLCIDIGDQKELYDFGIDNGVVKDPSGAVAIHTKEPLDEILKRHSKDISMPYETTLNDYEVRCHSEKIRLEIEGKNIEAQDVPVNVKVFELIYPDTSI